MALSLLMPLMPVVGGGKEHSTLVYPLDACMGTLVNQACFLVHVLGIMCCQRVRHLEPLALVRSCGHVTHGFTLLSTDSCCRCTVIPCLP